MDNLHQILESLKSYNWVNLTHDVTKEMPLYQAFEPLKEVQITTLEESGSNNKVYTLATSHGTHIDAPEHFAAGKRTFEDIPLKERVLPLYVIHLEDKVEADPGYAVTVEDIKEWEAEHGEIPAGSFVAFSSGWYKRINSVEAFENRNEDNVEVTPGWSVKALEFLSRTRNVQAIGHETLNTDSGVEAAASDAPLPLPAQRYWLEEDKYQVEMLANLDQVPAVGSLIFIGLPHIVGAPAFPCEAYAVVPEA